MSCGNDECETDSRSTAIYLAGNSVGAEQNLHWQSGVVGVVGVVGVGSVAKTLSLEYVAPCWASIPPRLGMLQPPCRNQIMSLIIVRRYIFQHFNSSIFCFYIYIFDIFSEMDNDAVITDDFQDLDNSV